MTTVVVDDYQKDKDEFASALDELFDEESELTDEEVNKKLDEELGKRKDEGSGEPTGDPVVDPGKAKPVVDDPIKTGIDSQGTDPATGDDPVIEPKVDDDNTDWQARALKAEEDLAKEINKTKSWNGRISAANKKTEALEEELAKLKQADDAQAASTNEELLGKFRDDFPELSDVVDTLQKQITDIKSKTQVKEGDLSGTDDDDQAATNDDPAVDPNHRKTIVDAHPELDELASTGVLRTWINQSEEYIKPYLETVYASGDAQQVISMITEFKNKTGWKSQLPIGSKEKAKQDKLNNLKEVNSDSAGPVNTEGPDKNDFDQGAKDAGF